MLRSLAILLSATCAVGVGAANGTIRFATYVEGLVNAPVARDSGIVGPDQWLGPGPSFKAQLVLITGSGASQTKHPLYPITRFRDGSAGLEWMRYVVEPETPVEVPGFSAGDEVEVFLRMFDGEDYHASEHTSVGESAPVRVELGGELPNGEVLPPALLVGLQGFVAGFLSPPARILANVVQQDLMSFYYVPFYPLISSNTVLESSSDFKTWVSVTNMVGSRVPFDRSSTVPRFFRLRGTQNVIIPPW